MATACFFHKIMRTNQDNLEGFKKYISLKHWNLSSFISILVSPRADNCKLPPWCPSPNHKIEAKKPTRTFEWGNCKRLKLQSRVTRIRKKLLIILARGMRSVVSSLAESGGLPQKLTQFCIGLFDAKMVSMLGSSLSQNCKRQLWKSS